TPAQASATLLRGVDRALVSGLKEIRYSSSAAVVLGYDRPISLPAGHGFLSQRTEGRKMLACTFVHRKFPFRAPEGASLLRCFVSSARVPERTSQTDHCLLATFLNELKDIFH